MHSYDGDHGIGYGHVVVIQKPLETCRNPVRSNQIPVFEDIDEVIEFVVVSVFEEKFHLLLALIHLEKHIDRYVTERKGTERALVFGRVLEEELILLTIGSLYDHMFDRNRLILEVEQGTICSLRAHSRATKAE